MELKKILVVDDEEDVRLFISQTLSRMGYEVLEAETGEIGLQKFVEEKPDLVVLDVLLPRVSGWAILEEIKSNKENKAPVIMLTVKGADKDKLKGYIIGADYYLSKPFSMQALLQVINNVTEDLAKQ